MHIYTEDKIQAKINKYIQSGGACIFHQVPHFTKYGAFILISDIYPTFSAHEVEDPVTFEVGYVYDYSKDVKYIRNCIGEYYHLTRKRNGKHFEYDLHDLLDRKTQYFYLQHAACLYNQTAENAVLDIEQRQCEQADFIELKEAIQNAIVCKLSAYERIALAAWLHQSDWRFKYKIQDYLYLLELKGENPKHLYRFSQYYINKYFAQAIKTLSQDLKVRSIAEERGLIQRTPNDIRDDLLKSFSLSLTSEEMEEARSYMTELSNKKIR